MRRALLLPTLCPFLFGCADMLGLGGLTFEQSEPPPSATGGATGGQGTGTSGGAAGAIEFGAGGQPPAPPPVASDEYFKEVGRDAVVGATFVALADPEQDDSRAFVLMDTGELLLLQLSVDAPDLLGSAFVDVGSTHLLAPTMAGEVNLLGYQASTGIVSWGPAPSVGEAWDPDQSAGSPGWSDLLLTGSSDAPFLVAYNQETGAYRVGPSDLNLEEPDVHSGTWETTLTHTLPFSVGDQAGVLRLSPDQPIGEFLPISDFDFATPEPITLPASGWTHACVVESDADLHLVVYSEVLGTVSRLSFDPALRSFSFADEGLWRTGLDQLVVVRIGGEPWLLIYDRATGILDLKSPFDLTPENVVVK